MANYLPPTEELPIFDDNVFQSGDDPLTYNTAITHFLKYPTAQGSENFINNSTGDILTISDSGLSSTSSMTLNAPTSNLITNSIGMINNAGLGDIVFNSPNLNSNGYAIPICFTTLQLGNNFNYDSGGQNFENVYHMDYNIPYQFISDSPLSGYTSNIWKIDFALNCYDCSTTGDNGVALYIEFNDQSSNIYTPFTYNLNTPYAVYQNSSTFSGVHSNFQNFNWSDFVSFENMTGTGSDNLPLSMALYWAGDSTTSNKFNLTLTLTKTNYI